MRRVGADVPRNRFNPVSTSIGDQFEVDPDQVAIRLQSGENDMNDVVALLVAGASWVAVQTAPTAPRLAAPDL